MPLRIVLLRWPFAVAVYGGRMRWPLTVAWIGLVQCFCALFLCDGSPHKANSSTQFARWESGDLRRFNCLFSLRCFDCADWYGCKCRSYLLLNHNNHVQYAINNFFLFQLLHCIFFLPAVVFSLLLQTVALLVVLFSPILPVVVLLFAGTAPQTSP